MNFLHRPTLVVLGLSMIAALFLSACNTTRGVGQDVENAGEAIQDAAK